MSWYFCIFFSISERCSDVLTEIIGCSISDIWVVTAVIWLGCQSFSFPRLYIWGINLAYKSRCIDGHIPRLSCGEPDYRLFSHWTDCVLVIDTFALGDRFIQISALLGDPSFFILIFLKFCLLGGVSVGAVHGFCTWTCIPSVSSAYALTLSWILLHLSIVGSQNPWVKAFVFQHDSRDHL